MRTPARFSGWATPIVLATLVAISGLGLYSVLVGPRSEEVGIVRDFVAADNPEHSAIRLTTAQSGRLAEIRVAPGDRVKRGQILAKLDTSVLVAESVAVYTQIRFLEMQLSYANAEADLQDDGHAGEPAPTFSALGINPQALELSTDNKVLVGTRREPASLAQARIDTIAAALDASGASLSFILDQIASGTIVSPVNGKVILVVAEVGQYLEPDHGVLMIGEDDQ